MSNKKQISIRSGAAEYLTYVAAVGDQEDSIEVRYEDENIWLTQKMMAALYDVSVAAINQHIKKIFDDLGRHRFKDNRIDDVKKFFFQTTKYGKFPIFMWARLFKRDVIKKCYSSVPDRCSYGEDMICSLSCILETESYYISDFTEYHYVYRPDSISNNDDIQSVLDAVALYGAVRDLIEEHGLRYALLEMIDGYLIGEIIKRLHKLKANRVSIIEYRYSNLELLYGKKVAVYGAGAVGSDYYIQFVKNQNIDVVCWADKYNYGEIEEGIVVIPPERIMEYDPDAVVIAVRDKDDADQIREDLKQIGITENVFWDIPEYI